MKSKSKAKRDAYLLGLLVSDCRHRLLGRRGRLGRGGRGALARVDVLVGVELLLPGLL